MSNADADPLGPQYLECPCCGDDGAQSDAEGYFMDGQALICGCSGWVSVSADDTPWINNGDQPCPAHAKCQPQPLGGEEAGAVVAPKDHE